jgi:hypothetical protein
MPPADQNTQNWAVLAFYLLFLPGLVWCRLLSGPQAINTEESEFDVIS